MTTRHYENAFLQYKSSIGVYNVLTAKRGWQILLKYKPKNLFISKGQLRKINIMNENAGICSKKESQITSGI